MRHAADVLDEGFNPYFTGSTTSTVVAIEQASKLGEFQSLFYWKYHFNLVGSLSFVLPSLVSILILLEVPLQQLYISWLSLLSRSFNPYFTGSTTSTYKHSKIMDWVLSFNPYFTGSTTSTRKILQLIKNF